MKEQIQQKLEQIAFNRSIPFCYGCYKEAPTGCASLVVVMTLCRAPHKIIYVKSGVM